MFGADTKHRILDITMYCGIFGLFILPFVINYNFFPVARFYSEGLSLVIAAIVGLSGVLKSRHISISSVGFACLIFALFMIMQTIVIDIRFPGINLVVALEFLACFLLSVGISSFINNQEDIAKRLILIISLASSVGGLIQVSYALMQYSGIAENFQSFILYAGGGGTEAFGNIGQKNDYVDFVTVGLFGLSYLFFQNKLNKYVYSILAALCLLSITITTSRIPFLFFILAILASFIFFIKSNKSVESRKVLKLIITLSIAFLAFQILFPKISEIFFHHTAEAGLQRFSAEQVGQTTYRRFYEWLKDLVIFINHPLFGIGWYQYPHEGIYLMLSERFMYIPANWALYTHSHNSPLNILAETGIIGFFITMIYGFGYSVYKMVKSFNNIATLFLICMILTMFGQGLFQYPLWYAYFLTIFVLLLSVNKSIVSTVNTKLIKIGTTAAVVLFISFFMLNSYKYMRLVELSVVPVDNDDYAANIHELTNIIDNNKLWSLPALMALDNYLMPGSSKLNNALSIMDQVKYIDMLALELPYPGAIFKQIIFHKEASDNKGSMYYANLLAHAYPYFKDKFASELQKYPVFNDEVSIIYNFNYQDKSIFTRIFSKKDK